MWFLDDVKTLPAKAPVKTSQTHTRNGFSLIDGVLGILLLAIVILGTASFRYYSMQNLQKAEFQVSASRVAEMLCQSWKGVGGIEAFDPITSLNTLPSIEQVETFDEADAGWPAGFTKLESFKIVKDSIPYYATLAYQDIQPDLRALTVMVAWAQSAPATGGQAQGITFGETDKIYRLTTYVSTE